MKFTKKPVTIEAVQFKHVEAPGRIVFYGDEVPAWIGEAMEKPEATPGALWIDYLSAPPEPSVKLGMQSAYLVVSPGFWIIRMDDGFLSVLSDASMTEYYDGTPKQQFNEAFEQRQAPSPYDQVKASIHLDADHAWGWHCNLAMPIMDAIGCSHEDSNKAAAHLMDHLWNYDITTHPHYEGEKSGAQHYAEARKEAEREEDEQIAREPLTYGKIAERMKAANERHIRQSVGKSAAVMKFVPVERVIEAIADPVLREYFTGMNAHYRETLVETKEMAERMVQAARLTRAFLGSEEQREAYDQVMKLLTGE